MSGEISNWSYLWFLLSPNCHISEALMFVCLHGLLIGHYPAHKVIFLFFRERLWRLEDMSVLRGISHDSQVRRNQACPKGKMNREGLLYRRHQRRGRKYMWQRWSKIFKMDWKEQKPNSLLITNYSSFEDSMGYLCYSLHCLIVTPACSFVKKAEPHWTLRQSYWLRI